MSPRLHVRRQVFALAALIVLAAAFDAALLAVCVGSHHDEESEGAG